MSFTRVSRRTPLASAAVVAVVAVVTGVPLLAGCGDDADASAAEGELGDSADAAVLPASDRARHITLHDLYADGGATLRA
ncbi:hypothetical protein SUDANB140_00393 [Streptomyces sp. enrichment culture]